MNPTSSTYLTSFNKTIVALLIPLVAFLNQKYGMALPMDAETLSALVGLVTALAVYVTPNRVNSSQAAAIVAATADDPQVQRKADAIVAADRAGS